MKRRLHPTAHIAAAAVLAATMALPCAVIAAADAAVVAQSGRIDSTAIKKFLQQRKRRQAERRAQQVFDQPRDTRSDLGTGATQMQTRIKRFTDALMKEFRERLAHELESQP